MLNNKSDRNDLWGLENLDESSKGQEMEVVQEERKQRADMAYELDGDDTLTDKMPNKQDQLLEDLDNLF